MPEHEPKDFRLARRAYEAFWKEQPQIWFEQLSHEYQMRWVNVVREIIKERSKDYAREGLEDQRRTPQTGSWEKKSIILSEQPETRLQEAKAIVAAAPRKGGKGLHIDHMSMSKADSDRVRSAMHYIAQYKRKR